MVAQERINVRETVGRKNNCKVNFFSMYFVGTKEEIHFLLKIVKNGDTSFKFLLEKGGRGGGDKAKWRGLSKNWQLPSYIEVFLEIPHDAA